MPTEDEPFFNPFDGFYAHMRTCELRNKLEIWIEFKGNGETLRDCCIQEFPNTVPGRGRAERLHAFMRGLCRYLNAGGRKWEMIEALNACQRLFEDVAIEPEPMWELMSVLQDVEEPTTVWVNQNTGRVLVVREDESSEYMDLEDLDDLRT